ARRAGPPRSVGSPQGSLRRPPPNRRGQRSVLARSCRTTLSRWCPAYLPRQNRTDRGGFASVETTEVRGGAPQWVQRDGVRRTPSTASSARHMARHIRERGPQPAGTVTPTESPTTDDER